MKVRLLFPASAVVLMAACGGSSSPSSPSTPSTTTPTGTSGYTFTADTGTRVNNASRPAGFALGGNIYLCVMNPGVSLFRSTDGGLTFSALPVTSRPSATGSSAFAVLPDGRVRWYFADVNSTAIQSAIGDGTNFTTESGTRGTIGARQVLVPKVAVAPGGGYRAFFRDQTGEQGEIRSAFSNDGLSFADEPGTRMVGTSGTSTSYDWAVPAPGASSAGWMMVVEQLPRLSGPPLLFLARSSDGLTWTVESTSFASGGQDPVVIPTGTDQYRVYYVANGNIVSGSIRR